VQTTTQPSTGARCPCLLTHQFLHDSQLEGNEFLLLSAVVTSGVDALVAVFNVRNTRIPSSIVENGTVVSAYSCKADEKSQGYFYETLNGEN
jgi:hypothetical protein